jgi:hypothetical protein
MKKIKNLFSLIVFFFCVPSQTGTSGFTNDGIQY